MFIRRLFNGLLFASIIFASYGYSAEVVDRYKDRPKDYPGLNQCKPKACCPAPKACPKPCAQPAPAPAQTPQPQAPSPQQQCPKPCPQPCPPCERMGIKPIPCCETPCQDPCCPPMYVYNSNINPPAHCTQCSNGFVVSADFLYWIARENDFSLAFNQSGDASISSPFAGPGTNGSIVRFKYDWEPAFRVGLGWQGNDFEGWDINLNWTWYRNNSHTKASSEVSNLGDGLVPYWGSTVSSLYAAENLHAKWKLLYNMFDLELGRDFNVSCRLALRPHFGLEGGWINRKWNVTYSEFFLDAFTAPNSSITDSFKQKSNYWGIGPRGGLNGSWMLGAGFKLLGNLSGALLSGNSYDNKATLVTTDGLVTVSNSWHDSSFFQVVPHLQALVGVNWGMCFSCNSYYLGITAGWEVNQYWNAPIMIFPDEISSSGTPIFNRENRTGNLALSGLTVDVRFEF